MVQAEQTINGDYEFIHGAHTFKAVSYARCMSWIKGDGKIVIRGRNTITRSILTDSSEPNVALDGWDNVEVQNTNFKLVKADSH